jgi:outer membrane protein assembly factor BamA
MRSVQALLGLAASLVAGAAAAAGPEAAGQAAQSSGEAAAHGKAGGKPTVVVMPIPQANPALGNGLALAALALYQPSGTGGVWTTGVGGLYTDTDSWAAAVFQKAHFAQDRLRITAGGGYGDMNLDFYGVGAGAGERDFSIGLNQKGVFVLAQGLYRVAPDLYLGAQYRFLKVDTTLDQDGPPLFPDLDLPAFELESQVSGVGPAAEYDTRDVEYGPTKGLYAQAQWLWNGDLVGSDFNYSKFTGSVNGYHGVGQGVLAWRGSLCAAGDGAPFYDLCMYGQQNDLRGYAGGQYRDRALWAAQVEYRQPLFWRFGAVAFAGLGGVAPGISHLGDSTVLPAAGVGLRFAASKKYKVNMSLDAAWGKDSSAVYFYLGEAF